MFEWTNPEKVKNFTQYYLYLLFSYNGRIGPGDFARGLFFGYIGLAFVSFFLSILPAFYVDPYGESPVPFFLWFLAALTLMFINILPLLFLPLKRLKDMGWGEDGRALIIFFCYCGTLLFFIGPLILLVTCLFGVEQKVGNPNGKRCTIHQDLNARIEKLLSEGSAFLKIKDFEGAIRAYEKLGDKKLVSQTKKNHVSHKFDLLHTQISRMVDKEVLCEDLVKMTNGLTTSVNNYLGFKPEEAGKSEK